MGGDNGLRVSLPAALQSLKQYPDLTLALVGDQPVISKALQQYTVVYDRLEIIHAADVVEMSDKPSVALRKKTSSSMRIAIDLLQQQSVDAVVSAGNTGALMAMGCYVLKTLPGIDRPAICSSWPTVNGCCYVLDLGANVDSCAETLHQFAIMGSAMCSVLDDIARPRVALLNIGEESVKGNEQVKLANQLLTEDSGLNYVGYVEGDALFKGSVDVIVCDGFAGNIALKVSEGTAAYISQVLNDSFSSSLYARLCAAMTRPLLKRISQKLNPEQYNGASLLGLQGVVVKSHGNSSADGFAQAISQAYEEVRGAMLNTLSQQLAKRQQ